MPRVLNFANKSNCLGYHVIDANGIMKSDGHRFLDGIIFTAVTGSLFLVLQGAFKFLLLDMEGRRLFVWDIDMWLGKISVPGGFSVCLSGFIVQFFHFPVVGTVLASLVLSLIFFLLFRCAGKVCGDGVPVGRWLFPLCLMPAAILSLEMVTASCSFQAIVDMLLICFCLKFCMDGEGRISVAVRIALSAVFLLLAVVPDAPGKYGTADMRLIYAAWGSIPLVMLVFFCAGRMTEGKRIRVLHGTLIVLLSISVWCFPVMKLAGKWRRPRQEQLARVSYYARNDQWPYILTVCRQMDMNNYMLLNYANLALSHQGVLASRFTDFRQDSPKALCIGSDMTPGGMEVQSMIYYQMGNIAAAQDLAFEANQYEKSAFLMQMLVKSNLIFGAYDVASKYIGILERTICYRSWAVEARQCMMHLRNGGETAYSPLEQEILRKRAGLPVTGDFVVRDNLILDLTRILESDPGNTAARDYAIVWLILSRDATSLKRFVDEFYGTQVLPGLSRDMEMGLLAATDGDLDYCRRHGVTEDVINIFLKRSGYGK